MVAGYDVKHYESIVAVDEGVPNLGKYPLAPCHYVRLTRTSFSWSKFRVPHSNWSRIVMLQSVQHPMMTHKEELLQESRLHIMSHQFIHT